MVFHNNSPVYQINRRLVANFAKRVIFLSIMLIFGLVILLVYLQSESISHRVQIITDHRKSLVLINPWKNQESEAIHDKWQNLGDPSRRHKIYSAIYDNRPEIIGSFPLLENAVPHGSIRIFAILTTKLRSKLNCHFMNSIGEELYKVRALEATPIKENYGMPYAAFTIMCRLFKIGKEAVVELPKYVALSDDNDTMTLVNRTVVPIRYSTSSLENLAPSRNLAICTGPIQNNYGQALRIVEYIHIARLMGVKKIYFYLLDAAQSVMQVLDYYRNNEFVEILNWNLHGYTFEKELRYGGIFAALNECVYRATFIDNFEYVAIIDLDEILVSFQYRKLVDFVTSIDNGRIHSFVFRGVFFHQTDQNSSYVLSTTHQNQLLYTQTRTIRTKHPFSSHDRSKYIVKGRTVKEVGNHFVWTEINSYKEQIVAPNQGLLFHYRDRCVAKSCTDETQIERTMFRYGRELNETVNETCQEIFRNGICPVE